MLLGVLAEVWRIMGEEKISDSFIQIVYEKERYFADAKKESAAGERDRTEKGLL